jgi:hypothetical protein
MSNCIRGTFTSTAIEVLHIAVAKPKMFPHLEAWGKRAKSV